MAPVLLIAAQAGAQKSPSRADIPKAYSAIRESDLVVVQDPVVAAKFFNTRAAEYRLYIEEQKEFSPVKVWSDVTVYSKHCRL